MKLNSEELKRFVLNAITEDIGDGDHSSLACIPAEKQGKAVLLVKEAGIIAGVEVAEKVFEVIDSKLIVKRFITDGTAVEPGNIVFEVNGSVQSILKSERLVLNIMQRMSGIATRTNSYVKLVEGTGTQILDTRKTTPNMRFLEKAAVVIGGGANHRFGLYDMIMLKDNHVDFAGGVKEAVRKTKAYLQQTGKKLKIEVEVRNLKEVEEVLAEGGVDRIMLDNFTPELSKEAVKLINKQAEIESSGGITHETIRSYAECGVDFISVGALTHHIKSLDLSLKANF
ncbi:MAG TPA: carboxylating nicotinate-nucleotide diphosphorylase [Bacteroidales bacterium]|nr:carboxylating nicotinate-nucleotide diphosphorylase [Bacteroidales bacterium]